MSTITNFHQSDNNNNKYRIRGTYQFAAVVAACHSPPMLQLSIE